MNNIKKLGLLSVVMLISGFYASVNAMKSEERLKALTKLEIDLYRDAKDFPGLQGSHQKNLVKYVEEGGLRPKELTSSEKESLSDLPERHRKSSLSESERDLLLAAERKLLYDKPLTSSEEAYLRYIDKGGPRPKI